MVADAMTKPLPREAHYRHAATMGLQFSDITPSICYACGCGFSTRNRLYSHIKSHDHFVEVPTALLLASLD